MIKPRHNPTPLANKILYLSAKILSTFLGMTWFHFRKYHFITFTFVSKNTIFNKNQFDFSKYFDRDYVIWFYIWWATLYMKIDKLIYVEKTSNTGFINMLILNNLIDNIFHIIPLKMHIWVHNYFKFKTKF